MKAYDFYAVSLFLGGCFLFGLSTISARWAAGYLFVGLLSWIFAVVSAAGAKERLARVCFCVNISIAVLLIVIEIFQA